MDIGSALANLGAGVGRGILALGTGGISELGRQQNRQLGDIIAANTDPATKVSALAQLGTPAAVKLAEQLAAPQQEAATYQALTPEQQQAYADYNNPLSRKDRLTIQAQMYAANPLLNSAPDVQGNAPMGQNTPQTLPQKPTISQLVQSGLRGNDLFSAINQLNPALGGELNQLLNGDKKISAYGANKGMMQTLTQLANLVDPDYSDQRYDVKKSFQPGSTIGQNISAMITAINHLASLSDAYRQLNEGDNHLGNYLGNLMSSAGNNPALRDFNYNADALANELAKVYKGSGQTNQQEINEMRKNLSAANTPEEMQHVLGKAVDLLNGRLDALSQQYQRGMGKRADFANFIPAETWQKLGAMQANTGTYSTIQNPYLQKGQDFVENYRNNPKGAQGGTQLPAVGSVIKGYRFKGGNPADKNSWEKVK